MRTIIHFTYADPKRDLPHLKREQKTHMDLCIPRSLKWGFQFFQNSDFNLKDLDFGFDQYLQHLTILHFSGHADMGKIELEDGPAFIDGFAAQMRDVLAAQTLPNMVLVFLNGCSTGSMVDALLKAGAPLVIGTSSPVKDGKAADFSIHFYKALVNGHTVRESFGNAEKKLRTSTPPEEIEIHRGARTPGKNGNEPLWGIFHQEDKKHLLDWQLPSFKDKPPIEEDKYEINTILKSGLYRSLLHAGCQNIVMLEGRKEEGEDIDEEINANLLLGFPGPIATNFRYLFNVEFDHLELPRTAMLGKHLENLFNLYQSLTELMFLIMLSQLWDVCFPRKANENGELPLPRLPVDSRKIARQLEQLKGFFLTKRQDRKFFDYFPMIKAIREIFDQAGEKYFVEELEHLKDALDSDEDFIACYDFFNQLSDGFNRGQYLAFNESTWEEKCEQAERHLAFLFEKIAFCARYDFAILKNIELYLPRHKSKPTYSYRLLKIPKSGNAKYKEYLPMMEDYTSVKTILMLKTEAIKNGEQKLKGHINLYPFFVDYNVNDARAIIGNLLIYSWFDPETGSFVFEEAFRSDSERFVQSGDIIYQDISDAINAFTDVLFATDIKTLVSEAQTQTANG